MQGSAVRSFASPVSLMLQACQRLHEAEQLEKHSGPFKLPHSSFCIPRVCTSDRRVLPHMPVIWGTFYGMYRPAAGLCCV